MIATGVLLITLVGVAVFDVFAGIARGLAWSERRRARSCSERRSTACTGDPAAVTPGAPQDRRAELYCFEVSRPKRNWIQEERRKTLGDYVAFCLVCGHVRRYFLENEHELPASCPECGGELRHRCPACGAPFPSAFLVECDECGEAVRPGELFGAPIRKPDR